MEKFTCIENNLTVNTGKRKLMYVSKRKTTKLPVIVYDMQPLQWVNNNYKYLGVTFSGSNNLTTGLKATCQQASKSRTITDMYVLKYPHVSLNHIFELFDSMIKLILTHGCAVWTCGAQATIMTLKHTTTSS